MPILLHFLSFFMMLASCSPPGNETTASNPTEKKIQVATESARSPLAGKLISKKTFGKVSVGMPVASLKQIYPDMTAEERPVYEFGIDGEAMGILLKRQNKPYLYLWTIEGDHRIHGITALSGELQTPNGLKVGSTVDDILKLYPGSVPGISYIDDAEYIYVEELGLRFEFLTTEKDRIGVYDFNGDPEPAFRQFRIKHARVDRISVP